MSPNEPVAMIPFMSSRNTGIFLPGHIDGSAIAECVWAPGGLSPADFQGDEAVRAGQGSVQGHDYTLVTARLFAVVGFALLDSTEVLSDGDVEMVLGTRLSERFGEAVFLCYDDEGGWGGYARFIDGALTARRVVDGRPSHPLRRDDGVETLLEDVDASHWIWPALSEVVVAGARSVLGEGVGSDDDIEVRVAAAAVQPIPTRVVESAPADPTSDSMAQRVLRKLLGD